MLDYLIAAPRTLVPLQIAVGGLFETGFEASQHVRAAVNLLVRYNYGELSKLYFGLSGDAGYVFGANKADVGGVSCRSVSSGWTGGRSWRRSSLERAATGTSDGARE